jgi:hypothetical protein
LKPSAQRIARSVLVLNRQVQADDAGLPTYPQDWLALEADFALI